MFSDLVALFSGWYYDYVSAIKNLFVVTNTYTFEDAAGNIQTNVETVIPEVWSAYVPWEYLIATVVLIVFIAVFFKFMRAVLCRMF